MNCPHCGSCRTGVIDSEVKDGRTRRRRECKRCKQRFTTVEIYVKHKEEILTGAERFNAAVDAAVAAIAKLKYAEAPNA